MKLSPSLVIAGLSAMTQACAEDRITFNEHIRPILSDNCFACHGIDAAQRKVRLRLDTPEGATAQRRSGLFAIVPGKVQQSELWHRIVSPDPPVPAGGAREHPVDRFIGAKLVAKNIMLAPEAPPEVLLRRLTLDLTGLPPTPEEVDAFCADRNAGAYERAVDRLLGSA